MKDNRKAPHIPTFTIFLSLIMMGVLGIPSLRQEDHLLRIPLIRKLLKSHRSRVSSDSTLARVVRDMVASSLRAVLQSISLGAMTQGQGKVALPQAGHLKIGVVDASYFGPLLASVFTQVGQLDMPLDLEPLEKRGKELEATQRLLQRLVERRGRGFIDLLAADGLYAYRDFFRFCRQSLGCHGVVKTEDETLNMIQDAKGLFQFYPQLREGIEYVEGVDVARGRSYQVWAASYFEWEGLEYPLRIAKVTEEHLKGKHKGQKETFYVLTSDADLSARDIREVAHLRWHIENNTFKALNEQCHSKHSYVQDPKGMERLLLVLLAAFILLQMYRLWVESMKEKMKLACRWENIAFRLLREWFWISLGKVELEEYG